MFARHPIKVAALTLSLLAAASIASGQSTPISDYTALGDASYATRLKLSDEQIAEIKTILAGRRESILAASADERPKVLADTNHKLAALLTTVQKAQFTELVAGNKLRFTFRNEPWAEVLNWFASQADLALVMNEAPQGVFSYSDSKNHTPSEAIDLLNGVLQSKGFTLVRRDKMLIVSPTKDGVAYDQVPKIAPDELEVRGRFEFVSVIFPLEGRPVENVLKEVSALLGTNGRATPLPATGQLMIVDTAGRVADIRKLIESIPKKVPKKKTPPKKEEAKKKQEKKPPPPSVFQVHSAAGLDIDRTIEVLRKLYGDKTPITGDGKVDQVSAFAPTGTQEAIGKTLTQLKANISGDNKPQLKTYSIVNQDLEQLQVVLAQANPGIQISQDKTTNRLFVVANAEQHRGVQQTLKTLNAVESDNSESVQVFNVRQELVDQVVELVKPLVPRASVIANGNRVAVRGTEQDIAIAKSAIAQLDAAEKQEQKPSLRFLTLKQKLEGTYFESLKQLVPDARISSVPNRNQLAVVATETDFARLSNAVEQIERETVQDDVRELKRMAISLEDPNRLLTMLKKEFDNIQIMLNENRDELLFWPDADNLPKLTTRIEELIAILPAKRDSQWQSYSAESLELNDMQTLLKPVARNAQFKPEPQRKRMMIWASADEHKKISQTLAAFQGEDTTSFKDVLLGYPVNRGDVAAVVSMLETMRPDVKFAADETANRILVTAPLEEQARIKGIIEQLDTAPGKATGDIAKNYTVQSIEPSTVIQLMQSSLPKLRMTANRRSVAAVGPAQDHKKLADAIKEFDENPDDKSVIAYNVGSASASQVSSILRQLIPGVSVSANESRQTVVVWGSESDHAKAKQAVEQFTKEGSTSQRTTEVYRLDRANNASTERVFERLAPRARVSRIYGTNSLVATATAEEHAMFQDVITKMKGSDGPTMMKVYAIDKERLNVDDVLDSLDESLRSRVGIRMNEQLNSLIVRGSEDDHRQMKQLIDDLVANLPKREQRVTEVYRLSHADPDTARYLLRNLFRDATFAEDDDLGTLAAVALPKEHKEIAKVIAQIDLPGQQTQLKTEIYRFDRTSARAAEDAFDRLAPRARVRYLSGSNSVIATATEADHKVFREIAEKMNGGNSESETKVYALDKSQINVDDVLGSIDDTLQSRMSIRMNEQMNSLIVRGSPEDQATMAQLIEEIKEKIPAKNQRAAKIYRFDNGNADQASYILRDLFEDVRVTSNDETGTVAVTALPEQHERIAQVVEQMDVPGQANRTTEFYRVDRNSGYAARDAFERMAPRARVSYVEGSNSLMATATEAEHVLFREAAAKMTEAKEERFAQVYTFKNASARYARYALREMFEDASITYDYDNGALYATATEDEHKQIAALVKQMDESNAKGNTTKVYRVNTASAGQVYPAISSMIDDGRVTYDSESNVLIVTATLTEHEEVQKVLEELNNVQGDDVSTQVYALKSANPNNIQVSLERLMPQVRVASDNASSSLIVSANQSDHKRVASLVQQLDSAPGQDSQMKAYSVKSDNARQIFDSLTRTFNGNGNFSISFQEPTNTIFVVATPKNQAIFNQLMEQLDKPELAGGAERTAKTYGLTNLSGTSARNAINGLLQGTSPPPTIEIDEFGSALILVGTSEQHQRVAGTLSNLAGEDSELEVFDLEYVDPWTVENAVDSLYANQPASSAPTMTSDYFSSRLFVRGNQKQIDQVRTLLSKMGETSVMPREANSGGDVRTIPFRGDVAAAVQQIKTIWPRMRKNRIEVVAPADPSLQIDEPASTPPNDLNPTEAVDDEDNNSVLNDSTRTRYAAVQITTRAPTEDDTQTTTPSDAVQDSAVEGAVAPSADTPVVIVPEEDQITIASTDHEALDQLEELFRAISRSDDEDRASFGSDFAVFLLRNTGAPEMRQLLADLFEQLRKNDSANSSGGGIDGRPGPPSGFGFGNAFGPTFGNVAVVADDRLNALIIHGDRKERELIRELLRVLDTKELANPIVVHQPELLRLVNTQADRVLGILQNVYKSQLQSGGGRRKVEIPEGVSPEVASVLQQINAAAGAPVLTLDVDGTTNSIVLRAPPELRNEIKTFVSSLDTGAGTNRSRNVRVIRLRRGKSDQIRNALQEFILEKSGARSSG